MTGILEQLKWESLKKRRKDNRLIEGSMTGIIEQLKWEKPQEEEKG